VTIPTTYNLDYSGLYPDLQDRATSRLLVQFQRATLLKAVLRALVNEVERLSVAIADVIRCRTLVAATGVNLDAIGRIVGQKRIGWGAIDLPLIQEDNQNIITEDGEDIILATMDRSTWSITDDEYLTMILLRITSNFNKFSSVPELSDSILQATGIQVTVERTGPMQVTMLVPPDTSTLMVTYLKQSINLLSANNVYLFPYPATLEVDVAFNTNILTEDGFNILTEDGSTIITEDIPTGGIGIPGSATWDDLSTWDDTKKWEKP
jgi:hypothetical protein